MRSNKEFFGWILATIVLVVLGIYLTPLKNIDLIAPTMHEIDPKALYADMQANPSGYIYIDVRDADVYAAEHAQGSINVPIGQLYTLHNTLPRSGKQIALICTNGVLAAVAYGYLQDWGFSNLLHVTGGLQNWSLEGLPTEGSSAPASTTAFMMPLRAGV